MGANDGDGFSGETMWTRPALDAYQRQLNTLTEALVSHARLVSGRRGSQAELDTYFASAEALQKELSSFVDAEFDWCGSLPLRLEPYAEDDSEFELSGEVSDGSSPERGNVLTVLSRYDYDIADAAALIEQGRSAHRQQWPLDTAEDAQRLVADPSAAVGAILGDSAPNALEKVSGLELRSWVNQVIEHDGKNESIVDDNPFAIADVAN